MNYTGLIDKILQDIEDAKTIATSLQKREAPSQLDIDSLREKLRTLYDSTLILEREKTDKPVQESSTEKTEHQNEITPPELQVKPEHKQAKNKEEKEPAKADETLFADNIEKASDSEEIASPISPQEAKKAVSEIEDYFKDVDDEFVLPSKLKIHNEAIESFKSITKKVEDTEAPSEEKKSIKPITKEQTAIKPSEAAVIQETDLSEERTTEPTIKAETKTEKETTSIKETPAPIQEIKAIQEAAENTTEKENIELPAKEETGQRIQKNDNRLLNFISQQKQEFKLADNLNRKPLSNIKSGVGINDVFLYTKELFNGVRQDYIDTVSDLDSLESLDSALEYIHNNFSWDFEKQATKKFMNLLNRRFLA